MDVRLRNVGPRLGREVVQVYASRPDSSVQRPPRWLVRFATDAAPGEQAAALVTVRARGLEHWDVDVDTGQWMVEPGTFHLTAGPSSAQLPLATEITVLAPSPVR